MYTSKVTCYRHAIPAKTQAILPRPVLIITPINHSQQFFSLRSGLSIFVPPIPTPSHPISIPIRPHAQPPPQPHPPMSSHPQPQVPVTDSTTTTHVDYHADLPTSVTGALSLGILGLNAGVSPTLLSHLKPCNPLPTSVNTPIHVHNLAVALSLHPDPILVDYVINGLTYGFLIGFTGTHTNLVSKNLLSATAHQDSVTSALCVELSRGHTSVPFKEPPFLTLHCSPLGSAEKKDHSRRLIMDLSQPTGYSINDGIQKLVSY